jgi:hypothetical protein
MDDELSTRGRTYSGPAEAVRAPAPGEGSGCGSTSSTRALVLLVKEALVVHAKLLHASSNLGRTLPVLGLLLEGASPGVQAAHAEAMALLTAAHDEDPLLLSDLLSSGTSPLVEASLFELLKLVLTEVELLCGPPGPDLLVALAAQAFSTRNDS